MTDKADKQVDEMTEDEFVKHIVEDVDATKAKELLMDRISGILTGRI